MKIVVDLPDRTVKAYLKHVNAVCGTKFKLETLTPKQRKAVEKAFAEEMEGEMTMRTDDPYSFEVERMFVDALDLDLDASQETE